MLTSLTIQGLRGLANAKLDGLAPVTVLLGPNGSGKTTILEACGVVAAGHSAVEAWEALLRREWLGVEGLRYVVPAAGAHVGGQIGAAEAKAQLLIPELGVRGPLPVPLALRLDGQQVMVDGDGVLAGSHNRILVPYE
ncbi:MAG TPA: AAA family ATPase, partial [Myxococcales bacterium]|nr:AAA family ATPase [Myxococcales bacterium]